MMQITGYDLDRRRALAVMPLARAIASLGSGAPSATNQLQACK